MCPSPLPVLQHRVSKNREPAKNLADDLLRDFEDRWWAAARQGDEETMLAMMKVARRVYGGLTVTKGANSSCLKPIHGRHLKGFESVP